ncbi:MAG: type II toxin-antitoxin system PemK/MazF family toxin [Candidatus Woesearchaeota archaeon]|nr:type II toxin-antitoxin system PemK/MazF family toxin [Candidatus Woesearchaeota archaeon]
MISGTQYKQGDVLIAPFPFTNLAQSKHRPVLVLSESCSGDLVTCGMTSKLRQNKNAVIVRNLKHGMLPVKSRIQVDKLFTLEKRIIRKRLGSLKKETMEEVKKKFRALV